MFTRGIFMVPAIAILLVACSSAIGQEGKPAVSLLLSNASAERREDDILFRCDAVLVNAGRKELAARSSFSSVFDGLELVVTTADGKILAQQGYTRHQSPESTGRILTLKQGRTERALVFPIVELPGDIKTLRVRLVGTLSGSEYKRILSSETLEIKVK